MWAIYPKHDGGLVATVEQPYDAESILQELLASYPQLLAGDQDDERTRSWLLVEPKLGIGSEDNAADRWSIDHLFLDDEDTPTVVEVKRSSVSRIRRAVDDD